MINFLFIRRILNLISDIIFIYFIGKKTGFKNNHKFLYYIGVCLLFSLLAMYNSEASGNLFNSAIIRSLFRIVICCIYLIISRQVNNTIAIYLGLLINDVIIIAHNVFMAPLTRPFLLGTIQLVDNQLMNYILLFIIVNIFVVALYYFVYRILPLQNINKITNARIIMITALTITVTYINNIVADLPTDIIYSDIFLANEFSFFSIILQFLSLFCLVFVEHIQYNNIQIIEEKERNLAMQSVIKNMEVQHKNDESLKSLRKIILLPFNILLKIINCAKL